MYSSYVIVYYTRQFLYLAAKQKNGMGIMVRDGPRGQVCVGTICVALLARFVGTHNGAVHKESEREAKI